MANMITSSTFLGTTFLSEASFYDVANNLVNPTAATLKYKKPDGTLVSVTGTFASLGKYSTSILLDVSGVWYFRWEATGPSASANEFAIRVMETQVK